MIKHIVKHWKYKPLHIILIFTGYFIGVLIISLGLSIIDYTKSTISDKTSGNVNDYFFVDAEIQYDDFVDYNKLYDTCTMLSEIGEIDIINTKVELDYAKNNQLLSAVIVSLGSKPNWHIPIIKGRYFNKFDIKENVAPVIIGKKLENDFNLTVGDKINLNGDNYKIVGVSGRKYSNTQWDDMVYILYHSEKQRFILDTDEKQTIFDLAFMIRENVEQNKNIVKKILYDKYGNNIYISSIDTIKSNNFDNSIVKNAIVITFILGSIIIIISMINTFNIINLWMLDRKFEFSIMRAFGATEKYIFQLIFLESTNRGYKSN